MLAGVLQGGKNAIKAGVKTAVRNGVQFVKAKTKALVDRVKGLFGARNVKPKLGSAGGDGAKKTFSKKVKDQARAESKDTCVFCGTKTTRQPGATRSEIDHSIPKSRGGNNSLENAQNTCRTCNRQKGAKTTEEFINR